MWLYHALIFANVFYVYLSNKRFLIPDSIIYLSWWRHQMETFTESLALCEGNPPVTGDVSLIWASTNGWANNRDAGDMRRNRAHYGVTIIFSSRYMVCNLIKATKLVRNRLPFGEDGWSSYLVSTKYEKCHQSCLFAPPPPYSINLHSVFGLHGLQK